MNAKIYVFGKEDSVKETHQGFLSRSIPARRRNGLRSRPHSAKKNRKFYYMNGVDVIREEAVRDLMRQLVAMEVFQDESDVRREALKFYNLMLSPLE